MPLIAKIIYRRQVHGARGSNKRWRKQEGGVGGGRAKHWSERDEGGKRKGKTYA